MDTMVLSLQGYSLELCSDQVFGGLDWLLNECSPGMIATFGWITYDDPTSSTPNLQPSTSLLARLIPSSVPVIIPVGWLQEDGTQSRRSTDKNWGRLCVEKQQDPRPDPAFLAYWENHMGERREVDEYWQKTTDFDDLWRRREGHSQP